MTFSEELLLIFFHKKSWLFGKKNSTIYVLNSHFRHLKKNKVAVTLVSTGFTPLFITKKTLYGNATSKYF